VLPELSHPAEVLFRALAGCLTLGTLLLALPQARRFFVSERWGGYARSSPAIDAVQNPALLPVILAAWFLSAVLIVFGWWSVWAALVNLVLCHYFFVRMRWRGVLRGMGAPGYMLHWLALCVFLLEFLRAYTPQISRQALFLVQVDFALIILAAGVYKVTAGYPKNEGMELGMVNPQWGYWWRVYRHVPPGHWIFRVLNHLGWATEVVAAVLMLFPPTRLFGGVIIALSFLFIRTQIRLGLLCETVMLGGLLFVPPGSPVDRVIEHLVESVPIPQSTNPALALPPVVPVALGVLLWLYLLLLPVTYAGLSYNFYLRRRLPPLAQRMLDAYANTVGLILWRVFTVDVVNFFVRIYRAPRGEPRASRRELVSRYGWGGGLRYAHVGESIAVTSVFTTLKYYPNNLALFQERLLRYARTVPCGADEVLVFEYVTIQKLPACFEFTPVAEFVVDMAQETITEHRVGESTTLRAAHPVSPVHEGAYPGSYAPVSA